MYLRFGDSGPETPSELILDLVEDELSSHTVPGNASKVLYAVASEFHDACQAAARDAVLNPSCHEPGVSELSLQQRREKAASLVCGLRASYDRDPPSGKVTLKAWCGEACLQRGRAIADPGHLVIDNTYPIVVENYRLNRS